LGLVLMRRRGNPRNLQLTCPAEASAAEAEAKAAFERGWAAHNARKTMKP
jgi:hypothetical protein